MFQLHCLLLDKTAFLHVLEFEHSFLTGDPDHASWAWQLMCQCDGAVCEAPLPQRVQVAARSVRYRSSSVRLRNDALTAIG